MTDGPEGNMVFLSLLLAEKDQCIPCDVLQTKEHFRGVLVTKSTFRVCHAQKRTFKVCSRQISQRKTHGGIFYATGGQGFPWR
jgi:hypothetical protein